MIVVRARDCNSGQSASSQHSISADMQDAHRKQQADMRAHEFRSQMQDRQARQHLAVAQLQQHKEGQQDILADYLQLAGGGAAGPHFTSPTSVSFPAPLSR